MTSRQAFTSDKHQRTTLSVRISIGLVCTATIPLLFTFIFVSAQTIPALVNQANIAMANDAQTNVQLIDTYFSERIFDVTAAITGIEESASFPYFQALLTTDIPGSPKFQADATISAYPVVLPATIRDKNYVDWAVFTKTGQLVLFYPPQNQPQPHGQSLIPPKELAAVNNGNTFISPVYYSPSTGKASVDIYVPIVSGLSSALSNTTSQSQPNINSQPEVIGIARATLGLDYIWNIVQQDLGSNGNGSYAFITDENGVRIADTKAQQRFTSIAPLKPEIQQLISKEARYGSASPVPVLADSGVANSLKKNSPTDTFQTQPARQNEQFQIVRQGTSNPYLHWNYFVLSPLSVETAAARQQQLNIALVALLSACGVATIGLIVGQSISRPILRAVEYLRGNSRTLNMLAKLQEDVASQEIWVVDSSQVGLEAIQYYTQATKIASSQLHEITKHIFQHKAQYDPQATIKSLRMIKYIAQYIEQASKQQDSSNKSLVVALNLATQVTEQLHQGATSASEAAAKLEQVVADLRAITGQWSEPEEETATL